MSGHARTALILFGLLAAGIGAAVWSLSSPEDDGAGAPADGGATKSSEAATAKKDDASKAARPKRLGTAAVFGEIRRSAGKAPVVGQEVVLAPERGDPWVVVTDAAGAFRFDHVPHGGPYELSATAKGCGAIRLPGIALDRNEKRNVGTLLLDPSVKLTVRVRSNADDPVAGAVVEAFPITQSIDYDWSKALAQIGQASISVAKATTDAKGEALFPEMAVGEWTFTARKDGFATGGARSVELRSGEEPRPVTIHLWPGYRLEGRVLAGAEKPIAGALVMAAAVDSAWDLDSAPLRARTTTDAEGRYAFTALGSGESQLWVARPGGVPSPAAAVRVPRVSRYDIVLGDVGVLAGTVTEKETGKPVEGATVRATSWEGGTSHGGETVTDAAGAYSLAMPAGAVNDLSAAKEGLVQAPAQNPATGQRAATLHEGETVVRDLQMIRGARLRGTVKGPDGPLGGVRVLVHVSRPGLDDVEKHATTTADGAYDFPSVEKGVALVTATKNGYYLEGAPEDVWNASQRADEAKELKVELGESGDVVKDLELKRGSPVEGRVDGPDGEPLAGVRITAPGADDASPTGADGAFRLDGVTPGDAVQLSCAKEGYSPTRMPPLAVVAGRPTTGIVLRMSRAPRVFGTVTSKSGAALRDAAVLLSFRSDDESDDDSPWNERWRWRNALRVPIRADGSYDAPMQLVPPGKLLARVESVDAQQTDAPPVAVVEGKESYEVNFVLDEGRELVGKVVAKGGAGVAGADVAIAAYRARDQGHVYYVSDGGPTVWAVTDAAGEFRAPHLAPGKYDVRAEARGFVVGQTVADLAASGAVVVELSPELTIEGTVAFADGRPVEGAEVRADSAAQARQVFGGFSRQRQSAVTDSKGAFRITGLGEGRYSVGVAVPWGSTLNLREKSVAGVAAGTRDLKIVAEEGGSISGRVVDGKRRPVTHSWVYANATDGKGDDSHNAEGKSDGSFVLVGLGNGPYDVEVTADDAAGNFRPKRVVGVAVGTKDLEIVLEDGLEISGVVLDDGGRPIVSMALECSPAQDEDGDSSSAWTDSSGKFVVSGLAPGMYRISVASWGGPNQAWVLGAGEPVAAGTKGLRLTAAKGQTICGVVVDEDGKPVDNAWVHAVDPKDEGRGSRNAQSRADGTFEIAGLEKGRTYSVRASARYRVGAKSDDVEVGATGLKLVLSKGLTSTGRLLDAGGAPLANAQISFSPNEAKDGFGTQVVRTDDDGKFVVSGLVAGPYKASSWIPTNEGAQAWKVCGSFKAGDANVELRVGP